MSRCRDLTGVLRVSFPGIGRRLPTGATEVDCRVAATQEVREMSTCRRLGGIETSSEGQVHYTAMTWTYATG